MRFSWLVRHKLFLFGLSIQLAALSFFPFIQKADAATDDSGGFIIQADRVVGENMKATIVAGETSGTNAKPMLRITYGSAQIYGMRLTKQFQTPGGTVSITMKASGPVHIKGMQVDTSAISFKGACVYAARLIPNAALEGVTMVAHSMNAANSSLDQLQLQTVNGDGGVQKPGTLKILQDLGSMPFKQMKKEIGKITSGQLPLTCEGAPEEEEDLAEVTDPVEDALEGVSDPVDELAGGVTDQLEDTIGKVTDPLEDTIGEITDPLEGTIGKVTDPIQDTVDKVTDPVKDTVGKATEPVKETVKKTADTAKTVTEPAVEHVTKNLDQSAKTSCEKLAAANGKITKELALELIDKALEQNKLLEELCPTDATLTQHLEKWTKDLLDSLGLLSIIGVKPNEKEQLKIMREAIAKEPDGSVITFE
jgi:gas vesicle protein